MECSLIFKSIKCKEFKIALDYVKKNRLFDLSQVAGVIYGNFEYDVFIEFKEKINNINIFINDKQQEIDFDSNKYSICFRNGSNVNKVIFANYLGVINFTVDIETETGCSYRFYSDYYDIGIKDDEINKNVRKMLEYIFKYSPKYLFSNSSNVKDFMDLKESCFKNMDSEISMLDSILHEYEINFKYFLMDSKYKNCSNYIVDDFEKLREINPEILQYIVSNPQYLEPVSYFTHIKYNRMNLQPTKVLINNTDRDFDIYENQVVVNFLRYLYDYISKKLIEMKTKFTYTPNYYIKSGYMSSYREIYKHMIRHIQKNYIIYVERVCKKIQDVYFMYSKILKCSKLNISGIPKPSHIFMSIKHYRHIYKVIVDWFKYGNYDFRNEKMLLSLLEANKIYEYYILIRINNYIIYDKGMQFIEKPSKIEYKLGSNQLYENTDYDNKFAFTDGKLIIILYYQPVIYNSYNKNQIGLFRNTSISFNSNKCNYYTPDYVIKIYDGKSSRYIILDAKWSNYKSTLFYRFREIAYKYIFSISTIDRKDEIEKVWAVNGKPSENQKSYIYNCYDSGFADRNDEIKPSAKILTLHPDVSKKMQKKLLDNLFSKI
jgi:hypothetical protein